MINRFLFVPAEDDKVDVIGLDGQAICWLPGAAAQVVTEAYKHRWEQDAIVANEWMEGVLFGIHHALSYGNQIPTIEHSITNGVYSYRMQE